MRQIACHEACKDPANVTLNHKFSRIGLDALDMCEVLIGCEREFDLEIAEENCELMQTANDLVEFKAKITATK